MRGGKLRRAGVRLAILAENADTAFRAIKSNKPRSFLTMSIIAAGMASLVGALTAVSSMEATLRDAYGRMGAGTVTLKSEYSVPSGTGRMLNPKEISGIQAWRFAENYRVPSAVTVFAVVADNIAVSGNGRETAPTVRLVATDEKYARFVMMELDAGRNFSEMEAENGTQCCIIGYNVSRSLFGTDNPVGRSIKIAGYSHEVIGAAAFEGNAAGNGTDDCILVPYRSGVAGVTGTATDFRIGIMPDSCTCVSDASSEAEMLMRAVRRLAPEDRTDFVVDGSLSAEEELDSVIRTLTVAAAVIGLITITAAVAGLMNIMLVSVRERTMEIGTRKAMGASSGKILAQFLAESVILCETGGIAGAVAGAVMGNVVAALMDSAFVIPWLWMAAAFVLCMATGTVSGYVPARKAASFDPIECLRHE